MGDIIGGVIGGIGSLMGGSKAQKLDMTGFNYLKNNSAINSAQNQVAPAQAAQTTNLSKQTGVADTMTDLLTNGKQSQGYQNYLDSTGYNFQMDAGQRSITGSAASKGLLNSGATAKALTSLGQNLASTTFSNYLTQLGSTSNIYGSAAQGYGNRAALGVNAAETTGAAGTAAGTAAGAAQQSAISSGFNQLGSAAGAAFNFLNG